MAFGLVSFNPVIRSYAAKTGPKESLARTPLSRRDVTCSNSCSVSIGISARQRQHHNFCISSAYITLSRSITLRTPNGRYSAVGRRIETPGILFGDPSPAADLHTVGQLLGHRDLRMTARYSHLNPEYLGTAASKLDEVFREPPSLGQGDRK